jgi:F-type H+-transporting ATPase subunit b
MVTTFSLLVSPFVQSVFWVFVAFAIFFLLFGKRLWSVMAGMLDARATAIRAELDEATRLRQEAEAMLKDAASGREAALTEAKTLLEAAKAEAERIAAAAAAEAEEGARRRERMAIARIEAAEKAAVSDVRIAATDVATQVATEVIRGELDASADAALVNHAIAALPAALARKVA